MFGFSRSNMESSSQEEKSSQKREITISLNKANKLKVQLKNIYSQIKVRDLKSVVQVEYNITNPVTLDEFKNQIDENIKQSREQIDRYFRLNHDYRTLKDVIFNYNIQSGVSGILSQMEELEMQKRTLVLLKTNLEGNNSYRSNDLTVDIDASYQALSKERENGYGYNNHVRCAVYESEELDNRIKEIVKKLSNLEDDRDRLNSNTNVTLSLDERTLEELGV